MRSLVSTFMVGTFALVGCSDPAEQAPPVQGTGGGDTAADAEPVLDTGPDVLPDTGPRPDGLVLDVPDVPEDVAPLEGEFLHPCESNSDCDSEYCVLSEEGYVCSQFCKDDCPDGWSCREVSNVGGADLAFICVQSAAALCKPCQIDADCNFGDSMANFCLTLGQAGRFCARSCESGGCPPGYSCTPVPRSDGTLAKQCLPISGGCPCLEQYDGFTTPCVIENAYGTCTGERICDGEAETWTECDAGVPALEICDGLDNDCSGLADDDLPAEPCEQSNALGTCQGKITCPDGEPVCDAKTPTAEFCDLVDNDCDGQTDEDLGETTCGQGQCLKTVPNCVSGQPNACDALAGATGEQCDLVDNDCDGSTDELDDLGETTCGQGQCAHTEPNCIAGVPNVCSPYEGQGPEVCDSVDNDCNGVTDDPWPLKGAACDGPDSDQCESGIWTCKLDGSGLVCAGDEDTAVEVCDGADNDCNGVTDDGLGETTCGVGICEHTVFNCSGGSPVTCDPMEGAQATDEPDPGFVDTNCDGIDGDVAKAVFVDVSSGNDNNAGTKSKPVKSITKALDIASAGGRNQVLVSQGSYSGQVVLEEGVGLFGGYNAAAGWSRAGGNTTTITGHVQPVRAISIDSATVVEHFSIVADSNPDFGGSSYGVYLRYAGGVILRHCSITAGNGGAGANGDNGANGANGVDGVSGKPGCEDGCSAFCSSCNAPGVGAGKSGPCGDKGGNGGSSAKGDGSGSGGQSGSGGAPGGYGGSKGNNGGAGSGGGNGFAGSDGSGGGTLGTLGISGYSVASGGGGGNGSDGAGGGGGGGGGGDNPGFAECCSYGGTGGGGGSGGCGGDGAGGGGGGGGSFGIYVYGGTPTVQDCVIKAGNGGNGGKGGKGGTGGTGGGGGSGGTGGDEDSTSGGAGGKGGTGGRGGHGGGGGGGPSLGVACGGGANPSLSANAISTGTGGSAGTAWANPGKPGQTANTFGCN